MSKKRMEALQARLKSANARLRKTSAIGMAEAAGALGAGAIAGELELREIRLPLPLPVPNSLAIAAGAWAASSFLKPGKQLKQTLRGVQLGALGLYGYGLRRELADGGHSIAGYHVGDFEAEG